MGTNYYAQEDSCETCNRCAEEKRYHIGKASGGWRFSLHVKGNITDYNTQDYELPAGSFSCLEDWKHYLSADNVKIFDEYSCEYTLDDLLEIITERSWGGQPEDLRYHIIDNKWCLGTEGGTWDLIAGHFR